MHVILIIIRKEFRQMFRNRSMLPVIFIMPVMQLLILSHAADFELRHIKMAVVDADKTVSSRQLIGKFGASRNFSIVANENNFKYALADFNRDEARIILNIPPNFERDLIRKQKAKIQIVVNAIDGVAAGLATSYAQNIIAGFNRNIIAENVNQVETLPVKNIDIQQRFWYNPEMNYKTYMVPGILVMLVSLIAMFLSAMNVVREKELGTIEQLNVTPIKKYQFIAGKLFPFWLLAIFELAVGLVLAVLIFKVPFIGSPFIVFGFAGIYLIVLLSFGLFVSTVTETQQQAMFISWFFMVIFFLMSGLFTPIESMPDWAQAITKFNPVSYFVSVNRLVMLKGATFNDVLPQFKSMFIMAIMFLSVAIWRYKKVV